jgi:hypothetical protein
MSRLIYRFLIALHPRNFRENHGDEMLCIFDERPPYETLAFLADALVSLLRQWTFHSGWWKLLAGAAVSSLLVFACGYSISQSFHWSEVLGAQRQADLLALYGEPPDPAFNEFEFEREAQEAVRMLTRYGQSADDRGHSHYPSNESSPDVPSSSKAENRE